MSMDPVTGSRAMVGWLAVHVNANDVAVCGAAPSWFSSCILLPRGSGREDLGRVARQIGAAARSLGVAVITGHSEIAPQIKAPIIIGHMAGRLIAKKPITTSGARPGDWLLMGNTAALEGSAILATDFAETLEKRGVSRSLIREARGYYRRISVVRGALSLSREGSVSSMHDPTEGGVLGGLYEMAEASGCGFRVYEDEIPVSRATLALCRAMSIDPLRLISSGALIASTRHLSKRVRRLGLRVIGRVTPRREGRLLITRRGVRRIDEPVEDELWRIVDK